MEMKKKPKVLFLSTGNSTRSQMAEGFLRAIGGDHFIAASAGIEAGTVNQTAIEVMKEVGIDISDQHPKNVTESLKEHFGYVITVSDSAKERAPIFPNTPHLLHWGLKDPASINASSYEETKAAFRGVRDQIKANVQEFLNETIEKQKAAAQGNLPGAVG
jgi:arsenate reductase